MTHSSAIHHCPVCRLPIAPSGVSWGYAGPLCQGHYPWTASEEAIRQIVREEIERARSPQDAGQEGGK